MPKITVITPTVRKDALDMVWRCLRRQTEQDFEWLIVGPEKARTELGTFILEPDKEEGDFYCLNKAWNKAYANAQGELIVNIVDGIWFPPDTLERLWSLYQADPKGLVTAIGHQYSEVIDGKPENMVWQDPRARLDQGSFYEVPPSEMEMCICSIPKKAVWECGGLDEEYDKGPAVGEKEMCWRLQDLGWRFYISQLIEYRAVYHERLSKDWDEKYKEITTPMFVGHMEARHRGERKLNVESLLKYIKG